jgi:hypothetical protein
MADVTQSTVAGATPAPRFIGSGIYRLASYGD